MMDRHAAAYKEEAYELLSDLESSLMELEESPEDAELIGRVFRAMHTIKGSGAMFGFDDIAAFTHEVETAFDMVRNGSVRVTKELIDLTLRARDRIRAMLDASETGEKADEKAAADIIAALRELVSPGSAAPGAGVQPPPRMEPEVSERPGENVTYRIRFRPERGIFRNGTNPLPLLNELREMGECRVIAHRDAIPMLGEIDPEACYTYWDIILTSAQGLNAIKDVFIFVEDSCNLSIEAIDKEDLSDEEAHKKLGDILIERGDLNEEDLRKALGKQKRIGELLVEEGVVAPSKVESALAEQQHIKAAQEKRRTAESASTIRVPSDRLDVLVNLVGELVTVQARLSQTSAQSSDSGLISIAEEVERLTGELRDNTMSLRMLPIGTTFSKFKRLVRDLSSELGREVEMTTDGAETELDKTVIEKLNDPLVHLIRNSIDHGVEPPAIRETAGKTRKGTIHLSAVHSGASVLIRIMDDGAGLDAGAIRAKAVERGLIPSDAELSEKEIFSLVLAPGFSTAKQVTSVSGRGVGMDVVKKAIDSLRGSIDISSTKGIGTTITLKLPLTLAIIEGLRVKIGIDYFIFPLSAVEECVELTAADSARAGGGHLADVRGQIVPYIRLREQFAINGDRPPIEQIVIVGLDGQRIGFVVDNVIGEHQTVIKTLGRVYKDIEGVSGATILGDGTVALILDIPRLFLIVEQKESMEALGQV